MKTPSADSGRNPSRFNRASTRVYRSALLSAAAASALYGLRALAADTYYLQPTQAGSTFDWNSGPDSYFTWKDITLNSNQDLPANAAIVNLFLSGTNGVSGKTVNMNYAYAGTNGIAHFYIDSGNAISQTSSNSLMNTTGDAFIGANNLGGGGSYSQSAGTVTIGGWVWVGDYSPGVYTLSANGTLNVNGIEELGEYSVGTINQNGGVNNTQTLVLGNVNYGGAAGYYNMSNGATLNVSQNLSVGDSGNGTFNMTGGTINIATNGTLGLVIGNYAGSSGTFTISGGSLNVSTFIYVANSGSGVMNITGGTVFVGSTNGGGLYLGSGTAGTSGTLNMSGGTLYANAGANEAEYIGSYYGNGVFNQSNGANYTTNLDVGDTYGGGNGTYTLGGGILSVSQQLTLGYYSVGVFNQNGGSVTAGNLYIGGYSSTAYTLNSGVITVSGVDTVGEYGTGTFTQNGGSHFVSSGGTMRIGYYYGTGTYNLNNGVLSLASGVNEYIGAGYSNSYGGSTAVFNQSGGTHTVGGTLYIDYDAVSAGTYNLSGGILDAPTIQINSYGVLNQTGGTLLSNTINLNGGTIAGTLQNTGTFNYLSGNFVGRLINQGTVNPGNLFTLGNGIENDGTMTVPQGSVIAVNGAGLDNLGTLTLQTGGTLSGTGPLLNDYGGVMNAAGAITGSFANNGQLNLTGLLTVSNPMANYGVISVPSADNLRNSGLTNYGSVNLAGGSLSGTGVVSNSPGGTIEGSGAITSLSNNGGLVYATGPTPLLISTLSGNFNGGELRVSNNATLAITNPFGNSGVVTLQGSNASFNGGTVTNNGTIQGAGRFSNNLLNSGVLRATGGLLTFSAPGIVNNAPGQIQATSGNTVSFTQGLTNSGNVSLSGGTLDTANAILNNTGQLLGNGTISTGGLLNSGTVYLSDANSFVYGPVTNAGSIKITSNTTTFFGFVNNASGTIKTTSAIARYLAGASVGGVYNSDPSQNYFTTLAVTPTGALIGGSGDRYIVSNDYSSASTQTAEWNTTGALLNFTGGGTHNVNVISLSSSTFAWGTMQVDGANTALLSGNGLVALTTSNAGSIQQISGSSSLGALLGTGSLTVGGTGSASVTALSLQQSAVTVTGRGSLTIGAASVFNNSNPNGPVVTSGGLASGINVSGSVNISNGFVSLNPSAPGHGVTNNVGSLSIGNGSVLDIGNHTVLVQNAPDETPIGKYLSNGYAGGFWNGTSSTGGAITSIVAFNDNSGATSIGYGNSADFTFGGSTSPYRVGGSKALTGNQVVVAPALAGDLLLSGTVGPNELALLLGAFGTTGNDWAFGNIDYDTAGLVGPNDLSLLLSNFGHSSAGFTGAKTSAKSLTSTAKPSLVASASDVAPPPADGIELIVNFQTGDVEIEGNNATAGTSIVLTSSANGLVGGTTFTPAFTALFNTSASNTNGLIDQFNTFTNGSAVNGLVDMGDIYNTIQNSGDIQFQFSEKGINRGGLQTGSVSYVGVPEPTTLSLLGLASAGLLGRSRRRRKE